MDKRSAQFGTTRPSLLLALSLLSDGYGLRDRSGVVRGTVLNGLIVTALMAVVSVD